MRCEARRAAAWTSVGAGALLERELRVSFLPRIVRAGASSTLASSIGERKGLAVVVTEATGGGIVRLPGKGETTSLFGDTYVVKAAGEETGERSR
jgi:hypothetical protein